MMLVQIIFVTVLFPQLASAITIEDCPYSQTRDKYLQVFGDKCYYFNLGQKLNYKDAQETCKNEGGNLAMAKSTKINGFLNRELSYTYKDDRPNKRVWIGLSDLGQEGVFRWVDGSQLDYKNFASGQGPRASIFHLLRRLEDCVAMDSVTGYWYDYKCEAITFWDDETRPFICEFEPEYHPTFPTEPSVVPTSRPKVTKAGVLSTRANTNAPPIIATTSTPRPKVTAGASVPSIKTTTPPTSATTLSTQETTPGCPKLSCNLDCDLSGFVTDTVSGCFKCKCNEE